MLLTEQCRWSIHPLLDIELLHPWKYAVSQTDSSAVAKAVPPMGASPRAHSVLVLY